MALKMTRIKPGPAGKDRDRYKRTAADVMLDSASHGAEKSGR
jgi:hypothetical protein